MWANPRAACLIAATLLAAAGAWATHAAVARAAGKGRPMLFAGRRALEFELAAPFDELFASADRDPAATVRARLSYTDADSRRSVVIDGVEVSVRGNSSRRFTECPFPKLKLKFPKNDAAAGTVFDGVRALRVGTHCDDRPDGQLTFQFGRWPNEKSPLREALVYRLLEASDVAVPLTRLARITYRFGPSPLAPRKPGATSRSPAERSIVRNALLLEDDTEARSRLGAVGELIVPGGEPPNHEKAAGTFENARRSFAALDSARVAFAEAMIGNFDWGLRFFAGDGYRDDAAKGLWNVRALARADGTAFPLVQDFDLAGIVTGRHIWYEGVFPARFGAAATPPAVEVLAQVQRTRSLFDRSVLDATRKAFLARKDAILSIVGDVPADPGGQASARAYLGAFFDAVASDDAFYRPVVTHTDLIVWAAADGTRPSCGPKDRVPIGTPATDPTERSRRLAHVELLDVFWHWADRCDAVRRGPVWIEAGAMEKSYPAR